MAGNRVIPAIGPSYALVDRKAGVQRSVNLYLRQIEGLGEDSPLVLASVPGLTSIVDVGAPIRGSYATDTRRFIVAGSTLYERDATTGLINRGMLATSSGFVAMKSGRNQLVLVDGPNGYVFSLTSNTFGQITDPDWRGSNWVEEIDGYFVFVDPGTDQFYISAIDDASTLDALDFSSADANPDNIVTHRVLHRELYFFGTRSTEIWQDSGAADFPFTRYNSTPIDVGIVGNRACVNVADTLVFVGQTDRGRAIVYALNGHQPTRISDAAVEEALKMATDLSQLVMWAYQVAGDEFVGLSCPGMETTWCYDFATKTWHERAEFVSASYEPFRADTVTYFSEKHWVTAGSVDYVFDNDSYTLAGDILARERCWPHLVSPSLEPMNFRSLELACTTGSLTAGNVTLEISNDGGYVFGPPLLRSLGAIGQRMQRVRWNFLGSSRDRVFRLKCTDPVPWTIHKATLDAN